MEENTKHHDESLWTNGEYTIGWRDEDTVEITGPYSQRCLIHGGDFEYVLSSLCAAFEMGKMRKWGR